MKLSQSDYFLLFTASFSLVGILTPLMRRVALTYGVIDAPTEAHKTHKNPIPYLGGVAIVLGVLVVSYGASLLSNFSASTFWLASSVLVPALVMAIVGLIDDMRRLSPWSRFIVQSAIGVFSAVVLVTTDTIGSPTGSSIIDIAVTVFWIVGLTNAINFFDNLDGGASGTVAISSAFLFLLAYQNGQVLIGALALVVAGATLGFLIWNRPPARIYMGDAGALFLGLLLASLTIRLEPNPINKWASFAVPIFLVAIPILDTSVVVAKRLVRGISPFQGGRDHLSHRLMRLGLDKRQAVICLWLLTFFFGALTWVISNSSYDKEGIVTIFGALIWTISFIYFARQADF
jgi:UDP-GlcNAc:undecaprenyl-phosphate/decaprenyl-phosphate GlcNAc-1-phosphate transferase